MHQCKIELESAKKEISEIRKRNDLECSYCDFKCECKVDLNHHVRLTHFKNQVSQTKSVELALDRNDAESEEFLCFYCEILLHAGEDLELHKCWCQPIPLTDFPCKKCGAQCIDEKELKTHMISYHKKYNYQALSEPSKHEDLNTCDFCGIKFGTLEGLRNHIRSLHTEMLPR